MDKFSATQKFCPDGSWLSLHESFACEAAEREADVIFIGDGQIAHLKQNEMLWTRLFDPLHALNFGIEGDCLRHIRWRVLHGEFDGAPPKVIVVCAGAEDAVAAASQLINEFSSITVPSSGEVSAVSTSASRFSSCLDFAQLYRELWQRDDFRMRAVAVAENIADELLSLIDCIAHKQPAASLIFWGLAPRGEYPNVVRVLLALVNRLVKRSLRESRRAAVVSVRPEVFYAAVLKPGRAARLSGIGLPGAGAGTTGTGAGAEVCANASTVSLATLARQLSDAEDARRAGPTEDTKIWEAPDSVAEYTVSRIDMPDFVHLSRVGYEKLCDALLERIQDLLQVFLKAESVDQPDLDD